MELLADSVNEAPTHLRQYLSDISTRDNVPRKEKQFRNFVANSMKISKSAVEQIWNFLKELKDKQQAAKEEKAKATQIHSQENKLEEDKEDSKMGETKPSVAQETERADKNEADALPSPDEIKKAMKKILKKEKDNTMPLKRLKKAVCAKYGLEKKGKKHMKKLLKEHLSGKKFVVDGKVVRLKVD